jgi:phosphoribosylaminoimidazolecarboxamide formyltransferase/IMP cyclohydrolase
MTDLPIRRALISVSDKTGLVELAGALKRLDVQVLSTGGTAKALQGAGMPVVEVADYTGFPEIMDGRVKTLQPKIHGGLLAVRGNAEHERAMAEHAIQPIDFLAVNLYPFEAARARGAGYDETVENIDIGGPAMIRAAAKNHAFVTVVVDPEDYQRVIAAMDANGGIVPAALRRELAAIALGRTAQYDAAVSAWLWGETSEAKSNGTLPRRFSLAGVQKQVLRYGENPHQTAALYTGGDVRPGVATARQLQGKELSYNNLNDADAAIELAAEFAGTACVIVKHANPCGVATGTRLLDAYERALACDTESAFGGIVAVNRMLDGETAEAIAKLFAEVVIAPAYDSDAIRVLSGKKNLRVLDIGAMPDAGTAGLTVRPLAGGFLVQARDGRIMEGAPKTVTKRAPTDAEMKDLVFAFTVAKHVKSNAIVYAREGATVGIGAGQMSRVNSSRIAAWKAADAASKAGAHESWAKGSVVASDAFFPFADGLLAAAEAGATAVIQPGGSVRDDEVIKAADAAGLAMVFTGMRHFRH